MKKIWYVRCVTCCVLIGSVLSQAAIAEQMKRVDIVPHSMKIINERYHYSPAVRAGNMLFIKNKDVPGVVGKIGLLLADFKVNIGEYILSREKSNEFAYSVIKVDGIIESKLIEKLTQNDEIIKINQINV